MKLIWHNYYNTYKKFYQVVLRGKRKLDLLKVEFYKLFNLNPYGKRTFAVLFCVKISKMVAFHHTVISENGRVLLCRHIKNGKIMAIYLFFSSFISFGVVPVIFLKL